MSIHTNRLKSGRTTYTVRYRDHAVEQQRRTFRTKAEAKDFELNISVAKANGFTTTAYVKRAQTFRDVAEAALASVADEDRKDQTRDGYDFAYRVHIYPTFGERRINTISSIEVETWLKQMRNKYSEWTKKKLSASTLHGAWIALNTVFKYAHRHGPIAANPCEAVKKPRVKVEKRREFPLQPGHVAKLARILDGHAPYGLLVRFAAHTGLREGELAALTVADVTSMGKIASEVRVERSVRRVKGGWKTHTPKTAAGRRTTPLPRALRDDLAAYLEPGRPERRSVARAHPWERRRPTRTGLRPAVRCWLGHPVLLQARVEGA